MQASVGHIERVMQKMSDSFDYDPKTSTISIETTPKIAASEPEKIRAYYEMGIRRISMGVQTTDFSLAEVSQVRLLCYSAMRLTKFLSAATGPPRQRIPRKIGGEHPSSRI